MPGIRIRARITKTIDFRGTREELEACYMRGLVRTIDSVKRSYRRTFEGWSHRPEVFVVNGPTQKGSSLSVEMGVDDQIWNWIDEGTEDVELPKRRMRFRPQASAATRPGILQSGKAHHIGTEYLWRTGPWTRGGIEARGWTDVIADGTEERLRSMIDDELAKFVSRWNRR